MTKDEALKIAHKTFMQINEGYPRKDDGSGYFDKEIKACKEALESQDIKQLNDEYLRDTYVDGLNQEPLSNDEWLKGIKILAGIIDSHLLSSKPLNKWIAPKPLSDDEIEAIVQYPWGDGREFARAIEQAHGIGEK